MKLSTTALGIGIIACMAAIDAIPAPQFQPRVTRLATKNLVPNGSFECGADGWLSLGTAVGWGGNVAGLYGSVESGQAADGVCAYRLTLGPGATPESYFDCWPPGHVVQNRLLAANRGWIEVEPGRAYTLSASMRTDRPGARGVLQLNFNGDAQKAVQRVSKEVVLTDQWQRYTYTVTAPESSVYVAVGLDVTDAPTVTTTLWVDAIQLEAGDAATPFIPREAVELGFDSGRYGNVYAAGTPIVVDVAARNTTGAPVSLSVGVRITDYWDQLHLQQSLPLAIPAGGRVVQPWPLGLPPGFYRAHFSWTAEGREHSQMMQLAVIEPYARDDSPFGLNHGPTTLKACQQFKQAGITWVRDWAVNWEWAEPQPGALSFAPIDPHINRLRTAGMNVLSLLPSNPSTSWASEAPDTVANQLWYRLAYAPKDPKLLFDFVGKAAAHYQGSVAYWEFLNEPLWVPDFCLPQKAGYTVDTYISLLKGAAAAIRSANPAAKILGGFSIQAELTFGDEFIKAGGLDYVDIYNLHPYAGRRVPETFIPDMERIRRVMDEYGVRKTIWATETAYYGIDEYPYLPWQPPADHFSANWLLQNERQAADYIVRFSTILFAHGVEKIFWHEPLTGDANNGIYDIENPFLAPGGLPRKSYVAISALANALGQAPVYGDKWQIPGEVSGHATGKVHGYAFANGTRSVLVAWAAVGTDGSETWALTVPAQASARNIAGTPLGGSSIALSESPVYVMSEVLKPAELARQCGLVYGVGDSGVAAPVITVHPTGQTVTLGSSVTLTAAASGSPAPTYQWKKNGISISGATAATLTINNVTAGDAGSYTVTATNTAGSTTSSAATLTVLAGRLNSETVTTGHSVTLSAANASGSIQWQVSTNGITWTNLVDGGNYSGVTTSSLTITDASAALNGLQYRFVATDRGTIATSAPAVLTVVPAFLPFPTGIAVDASGNLFAADANANTIQMITPAGRISLVAGESGTSGSADGAGANARFNQPNGVVLLPGGTIVVADTANAIIRRITSDGMVTTLAGSADTRGNADGAGSSATFSSPIGIASGANGVLFVADAMNHTIRRVTADGTVTTLAGSAGVAGYVDGTGSAARFNYPSGIAVDGNGNVYVADTTNNLIRKITADGTVTTLAGVQNVAGYDDGIGGGALFNHPGGLDLDASGNVYVADTGNSTIRRITPAGVVTTFAGLPTVAGLADGAGQYALFNHPQSLAVDAGGNIFVADTGNATIRKIDASGNVSTLKLTAEPVPTPTPTPTPTPSPTPAPPPKRSGGGGGAPSLWFIAALPVLAISRRIFRYQH